MTDSTAVAMPQTGPGLEQFVTGPMSPALAIMLDPVMFERAKQMATYLSRAEGFTPTHLLGKAEACFAVVTRSLTWKLDPFAVAGSTYQTPGGRIGYEGKLCQAILENSGALDGPVRFKHYGDWSKVKGKFTIAKSDKGKDYARQTWTRADAEGLGVTVSARVKGEDEPRTWDFDLDQAFPLNSTLWATDPKTQICYTAVRRFASVAAPGLFMGVPFDREDLADNIGPERAKDVTPPRAKSPTLDEFVQEQTAKKAAQDATDADLVDEQTGEVIDQGPEGAAANEQPPTEPKEDRPVVDDQSPGDADARTVAPTAGPPPADPEPSLLGDVEQRPEPPARGSVTLMIPGQKRPEMMQVMAASAHLIALAKERTGDKGAQWIAAAVTANPWIERHRPTKDGLRDETERCLTGG